MKLRNKILPILIISLILLIAAFTIFSFETQENSHTNGTEKTHAQTASSQKTGLETNPLFNIAKNLAVPNQSRWISTADTDNTGLIIQIQQNALPLNTLAATCITSITANNTEELTLQAATLEKTAIAAWDKTDTLNVSPGTYTTLYNGYRNALMDYLITASVLKTGIPATVDQQKTAYTRLISASDRMITLYQNLNITIEDTGSTTAPLREIQITEPTPTPEIQKIEPLHIPDAYARGTSYTYKDSREQNRISVTIPIESGRLLRTFYYTDKTTQKNVNMAAKDDMMYYMVTVSYTHTGHLDGSTMTVTPPTAASHTLRYENITLKPLTLTNAIGNALNVGLAYNTNPINRLEKQDMLLFYEVPANFTKENSYITINLGTAWGTPSWKLW